MKNKFIKILSIVLLSFALFAAFFLSSSAEERAVPENPNPSPTKTLSAGWYIFNDTLTIPDFFDNPNVGFEGGYGENIVFNSYHVDASYFSFLSGIQFNFNNAYGLLINYIVGTESPYNSITVYENGWRGTPTDSHFTLKKSSFQHVIIPNDVVCSSTFVDWFVANTQKKGDGGISIIEEGNYIGYVEFPLTLPDGEIRDYLCGMYLDFYYVSDITNYQTFDYMCFNYYHEWDEDRTRALSIHYNNVNSLSPNVIAFSSLRSSNNDNEEYWQPFNSNYIRVVRDCYVPTEFYDVFTNVYASIGDFDFIYEQGFNAGKSQGYASGYEAGRTFGYDQGFHDGETGYSGVVAPFVNGVLGMLDSFVLFADFSFLDLVNSCIAAMAMVWLLKLIAGG